jgi:hypothetical protein
MLTDRRREVPAHRLALIQEVEAEAAQEAAEVQEAAEEDANYLNYEKIFT